jgi:hypothetical protein
LIRVHRAVIGTQKAAQNRIKNGLATTTTHHAVGICHRGDVARWNEAFCSLFSSVFFKVQQTVHKKKKPSIHQDHLLFLTALTPQPSLEDSTDKSDHSSERWGVGPFLFFLSPRRQRNRDGF